MVGFVECRRLSIGVSGQLNSQGVRKSDVNFIGMNFSGEGILSLVEKLISDDYGNGLRHGEPSFV